MKSKIIILTIIQLILICLSHRQHHAQTVLEKQTADHTHVRLGSMGGFFTNQEVIAQLDSMRLLYPNLTSNKIWIANTFPLSTNPNPVFSVKISDNPDILENEPKILFIGLIHSDEPMSMMQMMYFMWYLLENYNSDPDIRFLMNTREIYFIPVLNPDGYIYNQTHWPGGNGRWRKNRQPLTEMGGLLALGIDINKNFSVGYIGEDPDPRKMRNTPYFRSLQAFWAHEVIGIRDFLQNKWFTLNLNYHVVDHNPLLNGYIIYPWNYLPNTLTTDSSLYKNLSENIIEFNRYRHGTTYGFNFEIDNSYIESKPSGTIEDWMHGEKGTKSMTIVQTCGKWPAIGKIPELANNLIPLNLRAVWSGGCYPVVDSIEIQNGNHQSFVNPGETGKMFLKIRNKGLSAGDGNLQLTVSTSDTFINIIRASSIIDTLPALNTRNISHLPFLFSVKQTTPLYHHVEFQLQMTFSGESIHRTIGFYIGSPVTLFSDSLENLNQWQTTDGWGLTTDSYSGRYALTESPAGPYQNNKTYTLINKNPFSLVNINGAWLEYYTKWFIEPDFDFATVSISTDHGRQWINLKPGSSKFSSGEAPCQSNTNLFGYYGTKNHWIPERISLDPYRGADSVFIRLQLQTDGWIVDDGWYLDNIRITGYPKENTAGYDKIQTFHLRNNYTNPFNPTTDIRFTINKSTSVSLTIYNVLGQKVVQLLTNKYYEPGNYHVAWNGRNSRSQGVSSGVYFYRLEANGKSDTKKMMLIR